MWKQAIRNIRQDVHAGQNKHTEKMYIQAIRNIRQDVYAEQDDTRTKQKLKEASMKDINKLRHEPNEDINKRIQGWFWGQKQGRETDSHDKNKSMRLIVRNKKKNTRLMFKTKARTRDWFSGQKLGHKTDFQMFRTKTRTRGQWWGQNKDTRLMMRTKKTQG